MEHVYVCWDTDSPKKSSSRIEVFDERFLLKNIVKFTAKSAMESYYK